MKLFFKILFLVVALTISTTSMANESIMSFSKKTLDDIMNIVTDDNMNEDKKSALLERTFLDVVDAQWIARYTLGRHWSALSPTQTDEFINLYKKYLINIYVPNFKKYDSDNVTITSIQEIGSGDTKEYLVKTTIQNDKRTTAYSINFRVISKEGKFLIFDFITEGVSMISTQRAEFNAIISAHGVDYLFTKLRKGDSINQ